MVIVIPPSHLTTSWSLATDHQAIACSDFLIARKLGEEAVETAVAALTEDKTSVAKESADVLYHLLALWAELGIDPVIANTLLYLHKPSTLR